MSFGKHHEGYEMSEKQTEMKCPNCLKENTMLVKSWYMSFNRCLECNYEWEKVKR